MSTGRHLYEHYLDWTSSGLKSCVFDEVLRLCAAMILAVLLNRLMLERRIAFPPLNWILTTLAFFLTMQLSLQKLQLGRVAQGWIFAICIFGIIGLPHVLSFYLWPTQLVRRRISLALYLFILILCVADFFKG